MKQRIFRPVRQTEDAMAVPVSWLMIETGWKVLAPTQRHEHSMNIWRRIAFFFRRLIR